MSLGTTPRTSFRALVAAAGVLMGISSVSNGAGMMPRLAAIIPAMIFPLAFPLLRILGYAYRKIGVPPRYMFAVMLATLIGSHFNIPVFEMRVPPKPAPSEATVFGRTYVRPPVVERGATVVAINVGGALVPLLLS